MIDARIVVASMQAFPRRFNNRFTGRLVSSVLQ
jgi:hypothetical protein